MMDFDTIVHKRLGSFSEEREAWENPVANCGYEGLPRNVVNAELNRRIRRGDSEDQLRDEREGGIKAGGMHTFLEEVAVKNPHMTFIGRYNCLKHVTVVAGEEVLGKIHENFKQQLEFSNNRILNAVSRGYVKRTTKIPVAVKLFNKFFYPATLVEKAKLSRSELVGAISHASYLATQEVSKPKMQIERVIKNMLNNNSQAFAKFLAEIGETEILKQYQECTDDLTNITSIRDDSMRGRGFHIFKLRDKWGVADAHRTITTATTNERVPEELIGNFAMLKTVEDNTFVQAVGYKRNENSYWIYKEND